MISVRIIQKSPEGLEESFKSSFKFDKYIIPTEKLSDYIATVIISRVRKRYMSQMNPDGTAWPVSKAAKIRMAGGFTYAKGGPFAPGGLKTGTKTLFSSGNLYHSIQLVKKPPAGYSIQTDVPYAQFYQNKTITIIGTSDKEVDDVARIIIGRLI